MIGALAAAVIAAQSMCIDRTADAYGLDRGAIETEIALRVSGRGRVLPSATGGFEIGLMRIPSSALPALAAYGVTVDKLIADDCLSIQVGSYMLKLRQVAQERSRDTPRAQCVTLAARRYGLPQDLIWLILRTENQRRVPVHRNSNGTEDLGDMMVNTVHLNSPPHSLAKRGITREMLISDSCLNIQVGASMLAYEIARAPDFWTGVTNYHSKNPGPARVYMKKLRENLPYVLAGDKR